MPNEHGYKYEQAIKKVPLPYFKKSVISEKKRAREKKGRQYN